MDYRTYEDIAQRIRVDVIKEVFGANSGHPGGSLSSADIVTALYFKVMNVDPEDPLRPDRDKLIFSKGERSYPTEETTKEDLPNVTCFMYLSPENDGISFVC